MLPTIIQGAIQLGVIPMIALFLVYVMHQQNKRLTLMLDRHEANTMDMLRTLVEKMADFAKSKSS